MTYAQRTWVMVFFDGVAVGALIGVLLFARLRHLLPAVGQ